MKTHLPKINVEERKWHVIDADGAVLLSLGDIDRPIFPRSAVKVLQALPLVASGAADKLGLVDAELAIACASHGGWRWTRACRDASVAYASLSGWRGVDRYQQFLGLLDAAWRTRGYGDFYSYMLLAEGAVDLVAEPELSLWDMGALAPIVTEAGGRFTGLDGIDGVRRGNALASNGLLHQQALSVIGTSPA